MLNNRKVRKSLSDQLDRMDVVLDGLAENLDQAVAHAVKQAVQGVLLEVMTNPDVLAAIRGSMPAPPEATRAQDRTDDHAAKPGSGGFFSRLWSKTCETAQAAASSVGTGVQKLTHAGRSLTKKIWTGCCWLATKVGSGLSWIWTRIKAFTTAAVATVGTATRTAYAFVRAALGFVPGVSTVPAW
jgi:hypothetical protein